MSFISLFSFSFPADEYPQPECFVDADCGPQLACIAAHCQNPCQVQNPCEGLQRCVVHDTLPTRTVACVCPEGHLVGPGGACDRVTVQTQCQVIC